MRKIIERKKITLRIPINRQEYPRVSLPTFTSNRTHDLPDRLSLPEPPAQEPVKDPVTQYDSEVLEMFGLPRIEQRLHRDQYITCQVAATRIKELADCINSILAEKQVIYKQEEIIPIFLEEISNIKDKSLNYAFMEKFYIPSVEKKNKLVDLLQKNEQSDKRLEWLEHKFLEAQAKLLEQGEEWLFHLRAQHMLFRLSPDSPLAIDPTDMLMSFPQITLLPSDCLESLIKFFRERTSASKNLELCFKTPNELLQPIKIFELNCQIKNRNTIFMETKLNEQRRILQDLEEKTESISKTLKCELEIIVSELILVQNERIQLEKHARYVADKCSLIGKRRSRLKTQVAVDSVVGALLGCQDGTCHARELCGLLERKFDTLVSNIFLSLKPDETSQVQLEEEWIKKEKRYLQSSKKAHKEVLRMQKLEERLKIALAPPYQKVKLPIVPFERRIKKTKTEKKSSISPLGMEIPYCFDKDIDMKLASKLYQPSEGTLQLSKKENPLKKSWEAVGDIGDAAEAPVAEIIRPRKSTESVLDVLESRSSYDFVLSTSSEMLASAERRDSDFTESEDNTSSASDELETVS